MFNSQQCPKSNIPSGQCLKHFVSKYLVFWIILIWFNQFHNFSNSNVIFFYQVEKKPKKFHILIHTPLPPFLSCKGYARLKHHSDHTQFKWNCNGKFYGSYNLIFFLISTKILNIINLSWQKMAKDNQKVKDSILYIPYFYTNKIS